MGLPLAAWYIGRWVPGRFSLTDLPYLILRLDGQGSPRSHEPPVGSAGLFGSVELRPGASIFVRRITEAAPAGTTLL